LRCDIEIAVDGAHLEEGKWPSGKASDDVPVCIEEPLMTRTAKDFSFLLPSDDASLMRAGGGEPRKAPGQMHHPHRLPVHQGELPLAGRNVNGLTNLHLFRAQVGDRRTSRRWLSPPPPAGSHPVICSRRNGGPRFLPPSFTLPSAVSPWPADHFFMWHFAQLLSAALTLKAFSPLWQAPQNLPSSIAAMVSLPFFFAVLPAFIWKSFV
jgi:hypothetical protein